MIIAQIKEFLDVKEKLKLGKKRYEKAQKNYHKYCNNHSTGISVTLPRRMKVTLKGREYPDNQAEVTAAIDAVYLDWLVLKDRFYGKIYLEQIF